MAKRRVLPRREFLGLAATATGAVALAACTQAPPPAPTKPAAEPTKAPAAASTAAPTKAPEPTKPAAVAAAPTKAPEPTKPAAVATAAPAPTKPPAATPTADTKIGRTLIGKLEGPELILDAAKFPKTFKEAPMLAEQVKAGKLPPVEKRLPEDLLVVKPVHEIGKYGGTWRRGFTGPADFENGNRIVSTDKILFWDFTGTKIMPSVAKGWQVSDDGKVTTIFLRKGMKWSDGQPFTANDFLFWFQDVYQNKDLVPTPTPELAINGKQGTIEKVDDYTVAFKFPEPYYLFLDVLAGDTMVGGGQAFRGRYPMGTYAPAHYLKQFHPKYADKAALDSKVKEAKVDNWVSHFKLKNTWDLNPELPLVTPWRTVTPINTPTWVLERNPYYWGVDSEGNQLPYIDKIVMTLAENLEVLNLRAIAGEYDIQERHTDLGKLPVFLENRTKGSYRVTLDPALNGTDAGLHINQSYEADPEIAKWLTNRDFRRALALGIDRDQLNETFWLGIGTPGSVAPAESVPHSPGPEYRTLWSTFDPKKANEMLDKLGLDKKDADGYRLRSDGKGRLRIEMMAVGGAFVPWPQHATMITEHWKKIGIQGDPKEVERNLAFTRAAANEHHSGFWSNGGSEIVFLFPAWALPVDPSFAWMGPLYAKWFGSAGQQGKKPADAQMLKAMDLFRSASGLKADARTQAAKEIWKILVEEQWTIGTVGLSPALMGVRIVKNNMGNIPSGQTNAQHARTPGASHPSTFYFKS